MACWSKGLCTICMYGGALAAIALNFLCTLLLGRPILQCLCIDAALRQARKILRERVRMRRHYARVARRAKRNKRGHCKST